MDEDKARSLLQNERTEVAELLKGTQRAARIDDQATDVPGDFGDAGLPLTAEAEDQAVAGTLQDRLEVIDRALGRLDAGTYGRSVKSGQPIPDARLEADPAAELTVEEASAARLPALGVPDGDLGPGAETQLDHQVGDVPGDGGRADHQLRGDGLVGQSGRDECGDLKFPGGRAAG